MNYTRNPTPPHDNQIPSSLDRLPDDRLAVAINVLRFLRANLRDGCRSWYWANGAPEFQAGFDLCNVGLCHGREIAGGVRVIFRRKRRGVRR
jgi:hypothetical protein